MIIFPICHLRRALDSIPVKEILHYKKMKIEKISFMFKKN